MKLFLVTTSLEDTWPNNQEHKVFLGKWCIPYSKNNLKNSSDKLAHYHWDNREKLYSDFLYLDNIYETLLKELSVKLNYIHNKNFSENYWRIIIGPWLGYFVQILFDRWFMLSKTIKEYNITHVKLIKNKNFLTTPKNMQEFINLSRDDFWNENIYGELIQLIWKNKINIEYVNKNLQSFSIQNKNSIKHKIKLFYNYFSYLINRSKINYFFHSTYMDLKKEFWLQLKLGQFPFFPVSPNYRDFTFNIEKRNKIKFDDVDLNSFEGIAKTLIPNHLPKIYLEGFNKISLLINKVYWPKKPKIIFTSNSYLADDFFKIWTANKKEVNSKYVIGQHGGLHGMCKFSFAEEHQYKTSDFWLSWGYKDKKYSNIIPIGNFTLSKKPINLKNKSALMAIGNFSRYSDHLYSVPISSQTENYIKDQIELINSLRQDIKENIILRLYFHDWGWEQEKRFNDQCSNIKIENPSQDIKKSLANSRIFIGTYNATTYLETLSWNIPTIIYWNPEHWEMKESSREYFNLLKSVGIFHTSKKSLITKLENIWDDIDSWWFQTEVQEARKLFCNVWSRNNKFTQQKLFKYFKNFVK